MKKLVLIILLVLTLSSLCGCVSLGGLLTSVKYDNESAYTVGGGEILELIASLEINWVSNEIEIKHYDGSTIKIEEISKKEIEEKFKLRYLVDGNKLIIQFATNGRHDIKGLSKKLLILIPNDITLDNIKINSVSGNINSQVAVKEFIANEVSGDVFVSNITQNVNINSVSGEISISAMSLTSIKTASVSGDIKISLNSISNISVSTVSGDTDISLLESLGFSLSFDTTSGDFTSSLETTKKGNTYTRLDGGVNIIVKSVSGDLTIRKNNN